MGERDPSMTELYAYREWEKKMAKAGFRPVPEPWTPPPKGVTPPQPTE